MYRWPYTPSTGPDESNIFRGITCVPDPLGSPNPVLIGTRSKGAGIQVVEPFNNHAVREGLHITDYFGDVLFGGAWPFLDYSICAYNHFLPDTLNGEHIWWAGLGLIPKNSSNTSNNGAFFLLRSDSGNYRWGYINDSNYPLPLGESLRATRTICKSPFPEDEGKVYYFGGYDAANDTSNNTAWIYKGVFQPPVYPDTFLFKLSYAHDYGLGQATALLDIKTAPGETCAFDRTVKVYRAGTNELLGMGDIRTELCYRSKRYPVLHFGLGTAAAVDLEIIGPDTTYLAAGLEADRVHYLTLDQLTTGSAEPGQPAVGRVYPNPAGDRLFIQSAEPPGRFKILDMAGRMVSTGNWPAEGIPVAGLAPGVYFLKLYLHEGPETVIKFIKQ